MELEYKIVDNKWLQVWKKDQSDGIGWDELQKVKNHAFGPEAVAIEIYPPESQVVNIKNIRHLWLVSEVATLPNLKKILGLT